MTLNGISWDIRLSKVRSTDWEVEERRQENLILYNISPLPLYLSLETN